MKFLLSLVCFALVTLNIAAEILQKSVKGRIYTGSHCEYIKLCSITSVSGCSDGHKFVIKRNTGVRKQFLMMDGTAILAFVNNGVKFTECTGYTEVTLSVDCKEVAGLSNVDLSATQSEVPPTCKCGIEGPTRIVGGITSTRGKYPWLIAMNFGSTNGQNPGGCGATLVASRWVVTAAHCVVDSTKNTLSVVLGEYDLSSSTETGGDIQRKNVKLALDPIVHESYGSPKQSSNDIALLKLAEDVDLAAYSPACLPAINADYTGQTGTVYGWGTTNACAFGLQAVLREVDVPIVSDAVCDAATSDSIMQFNNEGVCETFSGGYNGLISEEMVCAGSAGKDSCQGDSGGPFTVKAASTSQHDLVGVVSWGAGCAADGLYGVYAEVSRLRTWIDAKIAANGGATYCPT